MSLGIEYEYISVGKYLHNDIENEVETLFKNEDIGIRPDIEMTDKL